MDKGGLQRHHVGTWSASASDSAASLLGEPGPAANQSRRRPKRGGGAEDAASASASGGLARIFDSGRQWIDGLPTEQLIVVVVACVGSCSALFPLFRTLMCSPLGPLGTAVAAWWFYERYQREKVRIYMAKQKLLKERDRILGSISSEKSAASDFRRPGAAPGAHGGGRARGSGPGAFKSGRKDIKFSDTMYTDFVDPLADLQEGFGTSGMAEAEAPRHLRKRERKRILYSGRTKKKPGSAGSDATSSMGGAEDVTHRVQREGNQGAREAKGRRADQPKGTKSD